MNPSIASRCATALPIPEDDPVTMTQRGIGKVLQAPDTLGPCRALRLSRIVS